MANDDIEQLFDNWGEETVRKAFWLQSHIKRNGLDGIFFMHDEGGGESAESAMKQMSSTLVKSTIEGELDERY